MAWRHGGLAASSLYTLRRGIYGAGQHLATDGSGGLHVRRHASGLQDARCPPLPMLWDGFFYGCSRVGPCPWIYGAGPSFDGQTQGYAGSGEILCISARIQPSVAGRSKARPWWWLRGGRTFHATTPSRAPRTPCWLRFTTSLLPKALRQVARDGGHHLLRARPSVPHV